MAGDNLTSPPGHESPARTRRPNTSSSLATLSSDHDFAREPYGRPLNIHEALRYAARIPLKHFYLATILDDDRAVYFSSRPGPHAEEARDFFSERQFWRRYEGAPGPECDDIICGSAAAPFDAVPTSVSNFSLCPSTAGQGSEPHRALRRPLDTRGGTVNNSVSSSVSDRFNDRSNDHDNALPHPKLRKGTGGQRLYDQLPEDDLFVMKPVKKRAIRLGDSQTLWEFYDSRLKLCQQSACKLMAKAWIKVIAPKKQTHHPYTGKDASAPEWWPRQTWGSSDIDRVRHREPDHLYKKERIYLLIHLIRLVMQPRHAQLADILKPGLSIVKLEEITNDILSSFYIDPLCPANAEKKQHVDELFRVAKSEERYLRGEVDADTEIFVVEEESLDWATDEHGADHKSTSNKTVRSESWSRGFPLAGPAYTAARSSPHASLPASALSAQQTMLHSQQARSAEHSPTTSMSMTSALYGPPQIASPLRSLPVPFPLPSSVGSIFHETASTSNHNYKNNNFVVDHPVSHGVSDLVGGISGSLRDMDNTVPSCLRTNKRTNTSLQPSPMSYQNRAMADMFSQSWQQPGTSAADSMLQPFHFSSASMPPQHQSQCRRLQRTHQTPDMSQTQPSFVPTTSMAITPLAHHCGPLLGSTAFDDMSPFEPAGGPISDELFHHHHHQHHDTSVNPPPPPFGILPSSRSSSSSGGPQH